MMFSHPKDPVTSERRRHDRVSAEVAAALTVDLATEDGTTHSAVAIDVSTGGICLRWSPEESLALDVGQRVDLRIRTCTAEAPVAVGAVVRWTDEDDDGKVRYGLEFEDLFKIFEEVIPALWHLCHALHGQR